MGETSTVFGLIHDLKDRARARKVRDMRRNYLADPVATIQAVNEVDPDTALALRDDYTGVLAARTKMEQDQRKVSEERALGAARGLTQGLMRVRDSGGDVGMAFDEAIPVLRQGFGMDDAEIGEWKTRITSDPASLDRMYRFMNQPTKAEEQLYEIAPGEQLFDARGNRIAASPALPKSVTVRRPDGGTDVLVMDETGNFIQSGTSQPGAGVGGAAPSQLAIDPGARGVRNNNEGNIKDGPWARRQPGYAGTDGTFAKFNTPEAGRAAQERLLGGMYVNGVRNTTQIVDKYLGFKPGETGENSQASRDNYIRYVASRLGLDPSAPVPPAMLQPLAQAMREFENGGGPASGVRPAYSTPGKPENADGFRDLTPEENAARGLDPNRRYQIGMGGDNEGRIVEVPGQARPKPGKPGTLNDPSVSGAVAEVIRLRDAARRLRTHPSFEQATGSIQGALPSITQGSRDFDDQLQSFRDVVVIGTIKRLKEASPTGATGFGQLTEKEGSRLENSMGSLRATSPETLTRTLTGLERDAMISIGTLYNIPPEATMMLLQNPKLAPQFDAKYGKGRAQEIMGNR